MSFDRIDLFVAIAKRLNISEGSRACHMSQPAASRQLKLFQERLGIALITRRGRGIVLTPAGEALFHEASAFMSRVDQFKRSYGRYNESGLTIAGSPGATNYLLPCLMTEFRQHHPTVIFNLRTGSASEIESWILKSEVDVAVVTNPGISLRIQKEPLRVEKRTAFVRRDHPLAGKDLKLIAGCPEIHFVVRLRPSEQSVAELDLRGIKPKGMEFKIAMRCDSPEAVKQAVKQGAGVGILFDGLVRREIQNGDFGEVEIPGLEATRQRYLVYRRDDSLSPVAHQFLDFVRNSATQALRTESKISQRAKRFPTRQKALEIVRSLIMLGTAPITATYFFV